MNNMLERHATLKSLRSFPDEYYNFSLYGILSADSPREPQFPAFHQNLPDLQAAHSEPPASELLRVFNDQADLRIFLNLIIY